MSKPSERIPVGAIVWKGRDDRGGFCCYKVRRDDTNFAICSVHAIEDLIRLGYDIVPHWLQSCREEGLKAVQGLRYHTCIESELAKIEIHPLAGALLSGTKLTNDSFRSLLSAE